MSLDSAEALALLEAGNARFVTGSAQNAPSREFDQPAGQQPFAIVLGCSDSRVPIEVLGALYDIGSGAVAFA